MKPWTTFQTKRIKTSLLALTLGLTLCLASAAFAADPAIVNISVGKSGNLVTMDATLADGFNDSILEAIESGVPMTFTYHIELRQMETLWLDKLIGSATIENTVQYDSLKKVYRFSSSGKNVKRKVITRDKTLYQKLMLTLESIPIASAYKLKPEDNYYVRVKADLETDRLWFPFNYLLFFVPFNDFKTAWSKSSPLKIMDSDSPEESFAKSPQPDVGDSKVMNHVIRSFNR
ncbi:MAG: DUF4390 domain-containing protein [Nitrospinae bacterium]|nr:DUF4390 domain-containing protein [Nitrospinota bacterium]